MKRLHFYRLPRHIQDRFLQASRAQTLPAPIAFAAARLSWAWGWLAAALSFGVLLVLLLGTGYGELASELALAPPWMFAGYASCLAAFGFCAAQAHAHATRASSAPFRRGIYLFPGVLVDATGDELGVLPASSIEAVEVSGNVLRVRADGKRFDFPKRSSESAERAKEQAITGKRQWLEAELQGDDRERARLDPLLEPRYSNPFGVTEPLLPPKLGPRRFVPLAAAALGALLGVGLGLVRDTLSERKLFAEALRADSAATYRDYLARGGARPEVAESLLPNAELNELKRAGSLKGLEAYYEQHPNSKIRPAISFALREGLLAALATARSQNTLSALDEFARTYPSHVLVASELQLERQRLLEALAQRFEAEHAAKTPELGPFMRGLLRALSTRGPEVEVRFVRIVPESVARADAAVQRDPHFKPELLPSQYFDAKSSKSREAQLFQSLEQRFSKAFPPDALRLVLAEPLAENSEIPERVERPTLIVSHSTNMGSGIANLNPSGTFVGVGFLFKAHFLNPDPPSRLELKYSTWKPPDLLKLRKGQLTIPEVYSTLGDSAFGTFDKRLVAWLFRK